MTDLFGGLPPAEWDELARDHFYSSSGWLRVCASMPTPRCHGVAVRLDGGALGAVPVAVADAPLTGNYDWNRPLNDRGLPVLPDTGLLIGPSLAYHTHLLTGDGGVRVTAALLEEVRRLSKVKVAKAEGACVAMYLSTADVLALREAGVTAPPVLLEPEVWFDVPPGGWDAWLSTLRQTCRRRVRRDVRHFEALGYRVWRDTLSNCQHRLVPLAVELARKLGYNAEPARFKDEFNRYVAATGDAAKVILCENRDGTLMCFCMYYVWGDTIYLRWTASNYPELPGGGAEYFNLCYYSQVRLAGEIGVRFLHAGKKAIGAKVLRGGRLRPLWMLDLAEKSALTAYADDVRQQNGRRLRELENDSVTAKSIADRSEWEPFC